MSVSRVAKHGTASIRQTAMQSTLATSFDLLATAPQGVAKLRELILSLAVQGRLVWQVDASARGARAATQLPPAWRLVPLINVFTSIKSGGTPSKRHSEYWGGDIPWASVKDLSFGGPISHTQDSITALGLANGSYLAKRGSVLICTRMGLGKIGKAEIDVAINQDLKAVWLDDCVDTDYFIIFFQTLTLKGSGMTVAGIKQSELLAIQLPLPPLAEQHHIVARVEELMQLCDALEAHGRLQDEQHARLVATLFDALAASESAGALAENWQRLATHFDLLLDRSEAVDALEHTILQLAVRGLLVPQESDDETATQLLARIHTDKERRTIAGERMRDKPRVSVPADGQPYDLPMGWAWARFSELGDFGRGKSKHRPRNDPRLFSPGIYPLIQTGEVSRADQYIEEVHSRYSEVGLVQSKLWPKGTLCITIAANIADSAILTFDACFPDSVVGFVPAEIIGDARYFLSFMKTARQRLIDFAPATAQKNINLEVLNNVLIPLPPLKEMHRIVARVEQLRGLCAELRERLQQSRATQSRLAEALVTQVAGS